MREPAAPIVEKWIGGCAEVTESYAVQSGVLPVTAVERETLSYAVILR